MNLIRLTRGEGEIADVRPEWVDEWTAHGWMLPAAPLDLDLTREGIAAMEKPEVLELLEAHGWTGDKRIGVEKLRDALIGIVFVDL